MELSLPAASCDSLFAVLGNCSDAEAVRPVAAETVLYSLPWKEIQDSSGSGRGSGAGGSAGCFGICCLQRRTEAVQGGGYAAVCSSGMDRKAGRMADGSMPQYGRNAVSEKQCSCFSHEKC